MASRSRTLQNVFNNGEITPRLGRRVDYNKFRNSVKQSVNFQPFIQGGTTRRPGTSFVREVKDSSNQVRLIPFIFNSDQAYICEFGSGYIRFFINQAVLLDGAAPFEIASPYLESELPLLKYAQSGDVLYLTHPNHPVNKVIRDSATTFTINEVDFRGGPFLDENTEPIYFSVDEVAGIITSEGGNPFTSQHVGTLWRVNIGNGYGVYKITSVITTSAVNVEVIKTAGNLIDLSVNNAGLALRGSTGANTHLSQTLQIYEEFTPFSMVLNLKRNGTLPESSFIRLEIREFDTVNNQPFASVIAVSDDIDASTIATSPVSVRFLFKPTPVLPGGVKYSFVLTGDYALSDTNNIEWRGSSNDLYLLGTAQKLSGLSSWTGATGVEDFDISNNSSDRWREAAWSEIQGYPHAVHTYEQRLWFAATNSQPQTFWGSALNDFENFQPDTDDEITDLDAVSFTLAGTHDQIIWMVGVEDFVIATKAGPYYIRGGAESGISPLNPPIVRRIAFLPIDNIAPVVAGRNILFIGSNRGKLHEITYNENGFLDVVDRTVLAEHFGQSKFKEIIYKSNPDPLVQLIQDNGDIASITYLPDHDVVGWSRYTTPGLFENLVTIPNGEVWCVARRSVNAFTRRYVEFFDEHNGQFGNVGMDSCVVVEEVNNVFNDYAHLAEESLAILADKSVYPNQVATGGTITLDVSVSVIEAGFPFISVLVELEPILEDGQNLGLPISYSDISINVLNTIGLTLNERPLSFRDVGDLMDTAVDEFSGEKVATIGGWTANHLLTLKQTQPLPCTILSTTRTVILGDT